MEAHMSATYTLPDVAKRYPTLRFLVGFYKFVGVIALAGGMAFGIYQMVTISRFSSTLGFATMLGTILAAASLSGMCWLVAEGVEVFIGIEENTRQSALIAAQAATSPPLQAEMRQMAASLASTTRLLEQMAAGQQQTNQRMDALAAGLDEVRGGIGTGVKSIEAIAESSKVTATLLYRNGAKPN